MLAGYGGTEMGPIYVALPEPSESFFHYRNPFLGNVSGIPQSDARRNQEAACAANYDEARLTGFLMPSTRHSVASMS
jgi:hypothetical protein